MFHDILLWFLLFKLNVLHGSLNYLSLCHDYPIYYKRTFCSFIKEHFVVKIFCTTMSQLELVTISNRGQGYSICLYRKIKGILK